MDKQGLIETLENLYWKKANLETDLLLIEEDLTDIEMDIGEAEAELAELDGVTS